MHILCKIYVFEYFLIEYFSCLGTDPPPRTLILKYFTLYDSLGMYICTDVV